MSSNDKHEEGQRVTQSRLDRKIAFFRGFLKRPGMVASVIPSSRFLERRLVEMGDVESAQRIVELGPGSGGTTLAFLRSLPREGRLLAVELNPDFARLVDDSIPDPRLTVHPGDARELPQILEERDMERPQVIYSGIPFSHLPEEDGLTILRHVRESLAPGGCFIAYQVRDKVAELGRQVMGEPDTDLILLNIPPVRIYRWRV